MAKIMRMLLDGRNLKRDWKKLHEEPQSVGEVARREEWLDTQEIDCHYKIERVDKGLEISIRNRYGDFWIELPITIELAKAVFAGISFDDLFDKLPEVKEKDWYPD